MHFNSIRFCMAITLDEVAQTYFADAEFQKTRQYLLERRNASIPNFQPTFRSMIDSFWENW